MNDAVVYKLRDYLDVTLGGFLPPDDLLLLTLNVVELVDGMAAERLVREAWSTITVESIQRALHLCVN